MGFGSYDESENRDQRVETDDDGAVDVHQADHDGSVEFEFDDDASLLDRLEAMKDRTSSEGE